MVEDMGQTYLAQPETVAMSRVRCGPCMPQPSHIASHSRPHRTEGADLDHRFGTKATLITSRLAGNKWHAWLDEPTIADAILNRIVHGSHRIELKGSSLRKTQKHKR
jgi:hypothetical protein